MYSVRTYQQVCRQLTLPRDTQFDDPNFNPHIFFSENSVFQKYRLVANAMKQPLHYRKPCRQKLSRRQYLETQYSDFINTVHAQQRKQQRGISDKKIEMTLTYGKMHYINTSVHVRMTGSECHYMKTEFLKRKHDEWKQLKSQEKFKLDCLSQPDLEYLKFLDELASKNKTFTVVLTADTQTILTVYYSDMRLKRP